MTTPTQKAELERHNRAASAERRDTDARYRRRRELGLPEPEYPIAQPDAEPPTDDAKP